MDRREFLLNGLCASIMYGTGIVPGTIMEACAAAIPLQNKILTNLMMPGGPDFRYIFPPAYNANVNSFGNHYWKHMTRAHGIPDTAASMQNRWNNDYVHRTFNGVEFGIKKNCNWLISMWDQGDLAVICNSVGSESRDHSLAILVMDQGNLQSGPNDYSRSGWGGRLAQSGNGNVVALTNVPRKFCFGAENGNINKIDNTNLISLSNTRQFGLYGFDHASNPRYSVRDSIARSSHSYYAALKQELNANSPYQKMLDHESKIREFSGLINERLATVPIPDRIRSLYEAVPGINNNQPLLYDIGLGWQIRNLYDSIACNDILNLRVASMGYGDWDSHEGQNQHVENRLLDLFGVNMGFDALWQSLSDADKNNMVLTISGEFGRQIRDNGGNGTDHGRGNIMLVAGANVSGGVYGEMFPDSEILKLNDPNEYNPDIDGRTEFDHIYGSACDWVKPSSSNFVFPNRASAIIETSNMFSSLFS